MELDLELLNSVLENLQSPDPKKLTQIIRQDVHMGVSSNSYGEGVQGEEDNYVIIYKMAGIKDFFLRVEYYTDSYGSNESVRGIKFVKPTTKTVTVYE